VTKNERTANMELAQQLEDDRRWREEAARRLAPVPGQREAIDAARRRIESQKGRFRSVLRFLRGGR
jgi:predicted negative regulator of RcsB-dependent stress response